MLTLKNISTEYLRSFANEEKDEMDEEEREAMREKDEQTLKTKLKKGTIRLKALTQLNEREKAEIVMKRLFHKSKKLQQELKREDEAVLDPYSWQDLNLLSGNVKTPDKSVLNRLKYTQTAAGGCAMATQFVNPHTDVEAIQKKQATTDFLLKKKKVTEQLRKQVSKIAEGEGVRLSLWRRNNTLNHPQYKKALRGFYFKQFGLQKYNTSPWMMQLSKFWRDFTLHIGFFIIVTLFIVIFFSIFKFFGNGVSNDYNYLESRSSKQTLYIAYTRLREKAGLGLTELRKLNKSTFWQWVLDWLHSDVIIPFSRFFYEPAMNWSKEIQALAEKHKIQLPVIRNPDGFNSLGEMLHEEDVPAGIRVLLALVSLWKPCLGLFFCYYAYVKFCRNRGNLNFLATNLLPLQSLVHAAQQASRIIKRYPKLDKLYKKNLAATRALLGKSKSTPEGKLIHNLSKVSLRNRWYFFSYTGRLLATYKQFQQHKQVFADMTYEMALLDAQLAIVTCMEKYGSNKKNPFVFAHFESTSKPYISMKNMWNFCLDAKEAIPNDVMMDRDGVRFTIITGPNAGGKTTHITGAAINTLTGKAWGIIAAEHAKLSTFAKLITYINPGQNLATGLSLSAAGMEVLTEHKKLLDRMNKPVLAIVDEILSGVEPKVAAHHSYNILKERNELYPHCLILLTTHYMNLTQLADESPHVMNKKVVVKIPGTAGRKFDYTYKIEDGVADQNIVAEMLEEKGILQRQD